MVEIDTRYEGQLRCRLIHGPSRQELITDAPVDNQGKGEAFSPTDLVAAALGSCILTVMGIVAQRHNLDLAGTQALVRKEMINEPKRRISSLEVTVNVATSFDAPLRGLLERAAITCPVHHSLHPAVAVRIKFVYPVGLSKLKGSG